MTIRQIIDAVAATASRLEKESILNANKDNKTLRRVFHLAYDKQILFQTKDGIPESYWGSLPAYTLDDALDKVVMNICSRKVTGNTAIEFYRELFSLLAFDDAHVLNLVITKNLKCGATRETAEKIWPGILPKPPFQLAHNDPSRISYPANSQIKEDGTRCKLIWDGLSVTCLTRAGNEMTTHSVFDTAFNAFVSESVIIDGEFVAFKDGKRLPRKTSNGIVNKAVQGTISKEEAKMLTFIAWDTEHNGDEPYSVRLNYLTSLIEKFSNIILVEHKMVDNYEEAFAHFKESRKLGFEGTILKNIFAKWEGKRSYNLCKFKAEIEAEFEVIGYEEGTGKNVGRVGALVVASSDRKIVTKVGIFKDFDEEIRDELYGDHVLGTIVTVLYNERTSDKKRTGVESLFLPRVTRIRHDKTEANSYDEILEIEDAVLK